MSTNPENLVIQRAEIVAEGSAELCKKLLNDNVLPVDYMSIYNANQDENHALIEAVEPIGTHVFDKDGPVYRLSEEAGKNLPTNLVRICDPYEGNTLLGCVDFVIGEGQYQTMKRIIMPPPDPDFRELNKIPATENEKSIPYQIFRVISPELNVAVFFPSIPLAEKYMQRQAVPLSQE